MALSYSTYYAIPHIKNYHEAKTHYDNVKPIRRDPNNTRPVGRRDQKWFSMVEDPTTKAISFGYGWGDTQYRPLATYHPNGGITIQRAGGWMSAADNERVQRLTGARLQTYIYDSWVACAWYDDGVKHKGVLPLRSGDNALVQVPSHFVRDEEGTLVFVNYSYPTKHKISKPRVKEALSKFKPFLEYMNGLAKLQGGNYPTFEDETQADYFGWSDMVDYRGNIQPNRPPNLEAWPAEGRKPAWDQCVAWMMSDSIDDWMRAGITITERSHKYGPPKTVAGDVLKRMLSWDKTLFDEEVVKTGKLVRDRCKYYFTR